MFIKNIVKNAAALLNKDNVVKYLNNNTAEGDAIEAVDKLVRLTNLVISELSHAGHYVVRTQWLTPKDEKILYSTFRSRPIKIISIKDNEGKDCNYTITPDFIKVDKNASQFTYAYEINNETIDSSVTFEDYSITDIAIAQGVVAEYLLVLGDFDGAVYWHEKYVDLLKKYSKPKNVTIKQRSFV